MDVNDCPPHFAESSYTTHVAENSEVGATVTILTATDDDEGNNGQVTLVCVVVLVLSGHENIPLNRPLSVCPTLPLPPQVQYSLGPDESAALTSTFRIDPHTGVLTLAAPLDREAAAQYFFTVTATDGGPEPLSTSTRVTVIVRDYNDNPPVFTKDTYVTAGEH